MIRNLSVRHKFTAIAVATTAIILIFASSVFVALEINNYRRALAQELTAIAQITSSNLTAAIVFDDRAAAHETLTALGARPNIESAAIYTLDGRLFAHHTPGDTHENLNRDPRPTTLPVGVQPVGDHLPVSPAELSRDGLLRRALLDQEFGNLSCAATCGAPACRYRRAATPICPSPRYAFGYFRP